MIKSEVFANKSFFILGLGKTGISTSIALAKSDAIVFAWDDNEQSIQNAKQQTDGLVTYESPNKVNWSTINYIVLSPGIPTTGSKKHHIVQLAEALNIEIISDIDLLFLAHPNAKYVGITGTNGKSTTTALIGYILNNNGLKAQIGGNIGKAVLDLDYEDDEAIFIIELSSYQLEIIKFVKLDCIIFTNITPDHLDRHGNFDNYLAAKTRIFDLQRENSHSIVNIDYPELEILSASLLNCVSFSTKNSNADCSFIGDYLNDLEKGSTINLQGLENLPGDHNKENILAAYLAAKTFSLKSDEIIESIKSFPGLEHRMKVIHTANQIKFIDDSKASSSVAAEKSISCYDNIHWIVGGLQKTDGLTNFSTSLLPRIKKAYLIGSSAQEFATFMENNQVDYEICNTLNNAINKLKDTITAGDNVLLAPACASFDQFANFEHRGRVFADLVKQTFPGQTDE